MTIWINELFENGPTASLWDTLWNELYHQGDVGEASYAIIPYLVEYFDRHRLFDEQLFTFVVFVDLARTQPGNPPVPAEIDWEYAKSLSKLAPLGTDLLKRGSPESATTSVAAAVALQAGDELLARAYLEFGHDKAMSFLKDEVGYDHDSADA